MDFVDQVKILVEAGGGGSGLQLRREREKEDISCQYQGIPIFSGCSCGISLSRAGWRRG